MRSSLLLLSLFGVMSLDAEVLKDSNTTLSLTDVPAVERIVHVHDDDHASANFVYTIASVSLAASLLTMGMVSYLMYQGRNRETVEKDSESDHAPDASISLGASTNPIDSIEVV